MQINVLKDGAMSGKKRSHLPVSAIAGYLCLSAVVLCAAASGCAYRPIPMSEVSFKERAQTKTDGNVRVTVAVLSAKESQKVFGVDLDGKGIQSVWVKIENNDDIPYWFPPHTLDPHYYSPAEVAWKNHFTLSGAANKEMDVYFERMSIPRFIQPGATISGFAFVRQDLGTKEVNVALFGPRQTRTFMFFVPVPGIKTDYEKVDFDKLYPKDKIVSYDEAGLHAALKDLPPCTTSKNAKEQGDPLNLVVVGNLEDIFSAFIRSGWNETEKIYMGSALKAGTSFFFGTRDRYAPISPLYFDGRPQDISFQKPRETIYERNHLRLWLTPKRFEGKSVWVGQISRDIGIRFTSKTLMTHKIDPDVDDARGYIIYDLISNTGGGQARFRRRGRFCGRLEAKGKPDWRSVLYRRAAGGSYAFGQACPVFGPGILQMGIPHSGRKAQGRVAEAKMTNDSAGSGSGDGAFAHELTLGALKAWRVKSLAHPLVRPAKAGA